MRKIDWQVAADETAEALREAKRQRDIYSAAVSRLTETLNRERLLASGLEGHVVHARCTDGDFRMVVDEWEEPDPEWSRTYPLLWGTRIKTNGELGKVRMGASVKDCTDLGPPKLEEKQSRKKQTA